MSKELKALKELRSFCGDVYYREIYDKDYQIIETALKDYEDYKTKPRTKGFTKRDNRLRLAYQEMGKYSNSEELPQELRGKPYGDIIGIIPKDEERRWDLYLLFNIFLRRPIHDREWDSDKKCFIEYPCLLEELENRGYDVKTIYFEISKRNKRKKYIPFNFLRFEHNETKLAKNEKDIQKKLKALEIIKKKQVNACEIINSKDVREYNWSIHTPKKYPLTQEEYDLLKEVLTKEELL